MNDTALTSMPTTIHLTPGGHSRLRARIDDTRARYMAVAGESEAAQDVESSVWHDNFDYEEIQRQMHQLSRRVRDLELMCISAHVMPLRPPDEPAQQVRLGCVVTLLDEGGRETRWLLSGFDDGDVDRRRLAYNAPMGRALLGRRVGDVVAFGAADRCIEAEVVAIRPCTTLEDEEGLS